MSTSLVEILLSRFNKDQFVKQINTDEAKFNKLTSIALTDEQPQAWRAAWVINHTIKKNDLRLKSSILKIIKSIKDKNDGHQRELIRIIDKFDLTETQEGYFFDICLTVWEDISKKSGTRIFAFRSLVKIVKKHPELINEIESFTQKHYYENLSHGIKRSFFRLSVELKKYHQKYDGTNDIDDLNTKEH